MAALERNSHLTIDLNRDFYDVQLASARLLASTNRHADAVGKYGEILQHFPSSVNAWLELGHLLKKTRKYDLALECYQQVMVLDPDGAEAFVRSAEIHEDCCRVQDARTAYRNALERSSDFGIALQYATLLPAISSTSTEIEGMRQELFKNLTALRPEEYSREDLLHHGRVFFYLAYHGWNDKTFQQLLASAYLRAYPELEWLAPHCRERLQHKAGTKIRIAFVSRFFYEHTIAKLNRGLIERLSRELFEVHVFHLGTSDNMSDQIARTADHFTCLSGSIQTMREAIASCEADIVYYTDIGMEPLTYFLAFSRLAPIQCVTWGHPVTTGIPAMDWFISHEDCEMGSPTEHYTERLFCLSSGTALSYYYKPEKRDLLKSRQDFNLPTDAHIYVCPQSLFKVHPEFDEIMTSILHDDPDGFIVFIQGNIPDHEQILRKRLSEVLPELAKRIIFVPRLSQEDYLNLLAVSDVMLDTIHFGGGNSSAEAFSVGLPIVTLPSPYLKGRLTYAWYRRMRLLDCVAHSVKEYISIALRLGMDETYRQFIREHIITRNRVIFEDKCVMTEMESFFLNCVR